MIDLSFLTEEEQEAIMKVLQRDAELKRAEEERVSWADVLKETMLHHHILNILQHYPRGG